MHTRLVVTGLISIVLASIAHAAAPIAPVNVSANVSGTTVTLTWTAPSTGDAPTGYIVVAALSPGGAPIAALPVTGTTLVVPNVPNGVYYVHVRAVNLDGSSGPSNEVIVVVPGGSPVCNLPPAAPANLVSNLVGNVVTLDWLAGAGGCPVTGYVVQVGSALGLSDIAVVNVGTARTLTATAPVGTYYVRVIALNAAGASVASPDIVVSVGTAPSRFTIGFDGLTGVANRSPFTAFSEAGFLLSPTAQDWMVLTSFGNPAPFIQFVRDAAQGTQVGEVVVTAGGATFVFESIDVYSSTTPIPHQIVGVRNGTPVFTISGTVPNTFGGFATISNTVPAYVDTLLIRLTNPGGIGTNPVGFDNLVLRR